MIKDDSKKFGNSEHSDAICSVASSHNAITKYSYVIKWKNRSTFKNYFFWNNNKEYLSIVFKRTESSILKCDYMKDEIEYIVNNIKGIPVHNKR